MSTLPVPAPVPTFRIIGQVPVKMLDAMGRPVDGYRITGQFTDSGSTFELQVSAADYRAGRARDLILEHARQVADVDSFTG